MDAAAELGRNPVSKHQIQPDGTAEPVSRDQIIRHARGQGNIHFPCSADHEKEWQPYPVDLYSAICDDHAYIDLNSSKRNMNAYKPSEHPPTGEMTRKIATGTVCNVCNVYMYGHHIE